MDTHSHVGGFGSEIPLPPQCRNPCAQNGAIFEENFLPCLNLIFFIEYSIAHRKFSAIFIYYFHRYSTFRCTTLTEYFLQS